MIFPRSSIGKFGSSLTRPVFLKREQDESRGTFQKYYLIIYFLFVGDFSSIRSCRKHECFKNG